MVERLHIGPFSFLEIMFSLPPQSSEKAKGGPLTLRPCQFNNKSIAPGSSTLVVKGRKETQQKTTEQYNGQTNDHGTPPHSLVYHLVQFGTSPTNLL